METTTARTVAETVTAARRILHTGTGLTMPTTYAEPSTWRAGEVLVHTYPGAGDGGATPADRIEAARDAFRAAGWHITPAVGVRSFYAQPGPTLADQVDGCVCDAPTA